MSKHLEALYFRYNKLKSNKKNTESQGVLRKIEREIHKLEKENQ